MTGPVALKAAYIVTWVILLGYLGSLLRRFQRVREEMRDLKTVVVTIPKRVYDASPVESASAYLPTSCSAAPRLFCGPQSKRPRNVELVEPVRSMAAEDICTSRMRHRTRFTDSSAQCPAARYARIIRIGCNSRVTASKYSGQVLPA